MRCSGLLALLGNLILLPALVQTASAGPVLDDVQARGFVRCSVDMTPGFGGVDENGNWTGFDTAFCRAVATAVFGDPEAVDPVRITTGNKFDALAQGEVDIILGMTTWTLQRDVARSGNFAAVTYYDGQGFLAWKEAGFSTMKEADGASVCVQSGTTSEKNLIDFAALHGLSFKVVQVGSSDERRDSFFRHDCDIMTGDASGLAASRATLAADPSALVLFPERISREPLGLMVRNDDDAWFDIVKWTVFATILAEEKGVTKADIVAGRQDYTDPEIRRLLGLEPGLGAALGLEEDWAAKVIGALGNYGEIFAQYLGQDSPLGLDRGLNTPWTEGGLLYAPAFR